MSSITDDFMLEFRRDTERRWSQITINKGIYGFQIQPGTRWLPGLSETAINQYEEHLGFTFPHDMRRLLLHINGTDRPTLNVYGNCGEAFRTSPGVYSYPRDIEHIMSCIEGVAADRLEIAAVLRAEGFDLQDAADLLPYYSHRFVVCGPGRESSTVLSIMGTDAIVYAEDLRWYLRSEFLRSGQQDAAPNAAPPHR